MLSEYAPIPLQILNLRALLWALNIMVIYHKILNIDLNNLSIVKIYINAFLLIEMTV